MKYIVFIFLLYFIGITSFLGSTAILSILHYLVLSISFASFFIYIFRKGWSTVAFFIFLYAIIFPIYGSIKSNQLFGQSIVMGMASLRYVVFIMFGFFLLLIKYDYRLLIKQVNMINLGIAIFTIVVILILHVHPGKLYALQASNNVLGSVSTGESTGVGGADIRGLRFAACSSFMFISIIYYQLAALKVGGKRNWTIFLTFIVYLLFVHKGRQPIALMGMVYIIYYLNMKGLSPKRLAMTVTPFILLIILLAIDPNLMLRFTTILDGDQSKDFSTLARIKEVEQITPYIMENPIFGVGNLSAHFGFGGFQTYFGHAFYMADIGIIGAVARGGFVLLFIYLGLYISLWKRMSVIKDNNCRDFMKYLIISYVLLLVCFFNDVLYSEISVLIAVPLYPLFSAGNPNKYIRQIRYLATKKISFI